MNRTANGLALAAIVPLLALAARVGVAAPPPASRLEIAPSPTPSPPIGSLTRVSAPDRAQSGAQFKEMMAQHVGALGRSPRRAFRPQRSATIVSASQDVHVAGHSKAAFAHVRDACANQPPEIDRVNGDVTPAGVLTITGACFGDSGSVRLVGNFPFDPSGIDLTIVSWTNTAVKARLLGKLYGGGFETSRDSFTSALDQPVELRLATRRFAGGMAIVGSGVVAPPVRLTFRARRITTTAGADVLACATGDTLQPPMADVCGSSGWLTGSTLGTYHVRKAPASGEDTYALRLRHGYVLDQVSVQGDGADVFFDSSLDPSHVTFHVRWQTVHKSDGSLVKRGFPQYAEYNDGSYTFSVTVTGPDGQMP